MVEPNNPNVPRSQAPRTIRINNRILPATWPSNGFIRTPNPQYQHEGRGNIEHVESYSQHSWPSSLHRPTNYFNTQNTLEPANYEPDSRLPSDSRPVSEYDNKKTLKTKKKRSYMDDTPTALQQARDDEDSMPLSSKQRRTDMDDTATTNRQANFYMETTPPPTSHASYDMDSEPSTSNQIRDYIDSSPYIYGDMPSTSTQSRGHVTASVTMPSTSTQAEGYIECIPSTSTQAADYTDCMPSTSTGLRNADFKPFTSTQSSSNDRDLYETPEPPTSTSCPEEGSEYSDSQDSP